jgi:hypothetical protein
MELVIQVGGPKQLMLLVAPIGLPYIYLRHLTDKFTSNPDSHAPTIARLRSIRTCNRRPGAHNLVDLKTENRNDTHGISPPQSYLI